MPNVMDNTPTVGSVQMDFANLHQCVVLVVRMIRDVLILHRLVRDVIVRRPVTKEELVEKNAWSMMIVIKCLPVMHASLKLVNTHSSNILLLDIRLIF